MSVAKSDKQLERSGRNPTLKTGVVRGGGSETDIKSLNIVAHSMGNRVLGEAFRSLSKEISSNKKISNMILAAPDIDQRTFVEQIAPEFCRRAEQVTLYASSNDNALELSKTIHSYQRAGDTEPNITLCDGVYTIDASDMDTTLFGHSYYGDKPWVLQDIHSIINGNSSPAKRFGLEEVRNESGLYWKFRGGIR